MEKLKVALDWTVNTNHTGFFVARELHFYEKSGLDVDIIIPDIDGYVVAPVQKLKRGEVDFALGPLESVIGCKIKKTPFDAVAIAAIFTEDITAIASQYDTDIVTPKDLDGKTYSSYCSGSYGCKIVREMIKNAGGEGNITIVNPKEFSMQDILANRMADATWIFTNWEGFYTKSLGIRFNTFKMSDYNIPYGYSPVIMANKSRAKEKGRIYNAFLQDTKKGFLFAKNNPQESADIIKSLVPEEDANIDLLESQMYTSQYYGDDSHWGVMDSVKVKDYLDWMYSTNIEPTRFRVDDVISNELL